MNSKRTNKLLTFFSLYIAQSVPMSLFSTLLPVLMRQGNFSLSTIGLLQLIKLPWILKVFWAPFVDKRTSDLGSYKRWIFSSEMVYAVLIFMVAFLDLNTNFTTIFILIILSFIASATQDIATDALTALSFNHREKSLGNSMQSMGSFTGSLVGGGLLLLHYKLIGWNALLISVSLFVVLALIPLFIYKDKKFTPKHGKTPISMKDLYLFFHQKGVAKQLIFLILCYSGIIGILAMVKPFMVDLGYKTGEIGFMFGIFGSLVWLPLLVYRWICYPFNRKILLSYHFCLRSIGDYTLFLFYVSPPLRNYSSICSNILLVGKLRLSAVLVNTVAMDFLRDGREGTDFTLQTVIAHLSSMLIAVCSGKVADLLGYSGLFLVETGLAVISLVYILVFFKKPVRHE